jgi:hypothetical protein
MRLRGGASGHSSVAAAGRDDRTGGGSGHDLMLPVPNLVNAMLDRFLEGVEASI